MLSETKVTICNTRIENLSVESVDLITSRALAPLKKLIEYVKNFVNQSTANSNILPNMLFLKGKSYMAELTDLNKDDSLKFKIYPSLTDKYGKILYFNNTKILKSSHE